MSSSRASAARVITNRSLRIENPASLFLEMTRLCPDLMQPGAPQFRFSIRRPKHVEERAGFRQPGQREGGGAVVMALIDLVGCRGREGARA